jgi:cell division protein FtsW
MKRHQPDYVVLAIVIGLVMFGILMVFSASYYNSQHSGGTGVAFFFKQVMGAGIGFVMMLILSHIDYHKYQKPGIAFLLLLVSIILLVLVLFISTEIHGAKRWIDLGIVNFQPSEIARIAIILFSADYFSKRSRALRTNKIKEYVSISLPVLFYLVLICGLIILEPNLSMMISVLAAVFCIMIAAGTHAKPLFTMIGLGVVSGIGFILTATYRLKRFRIFLDPWKDPRDDGYQLIQSLYALGSGGVTGVGLGNSKQKHLYLTFGESDFILSIIGEELGFIGILILMTIFVILIIRGMRIAQSAPDSFGLLLATGIVAMIAIQVVIHTAVITSSMPPTGVPLPFVSSGNTSLIMFMSAIGVLLNISRSTVRIT